MTDSQVIRFLESAGYSIDVWRESSCNFGIRLYSEYRDHDDVEVTGNSLRSVVKKAMRECGKQWGKQYLPNKKTRPTRGARR